MWGLGMRIIVFEMNTNIYMENFKYIIVLLKEILKAKWAITNPQDFFQECFFL